MVVKVYISGISGNKEVKKRQQRVLLILDSKAVKYEIIDIAEPENEGKKDFMQINSTSPGATISDPTPRHPLPPQIFSDDVYCGDYDQFDMANEIDEMEKFLKLAPDDSAPPVTSNAEITLGNGNAHTEEITTGAETKEGANDNDTEKQAPEEAPKVDSTENGVKNPEETKEQEETKEIEVAEEKDGAAEEEDDDADGDNDGE